MGKKLRVLATILMTVLMMSSMSVFAAPSATIPGGSGGSGSTGAVVIVPACPHQTVTVKCGKKKTKKNTATGVVVKKNKKKSQSFKLWVQPGATVVSSHKYITVKKLSDGCYKITFKKKKKANGILTVSKPGCSTVQIWVKQK